MNEKRRRARVQGGWAAPVNNSPNDRNTIHPPTNQLQTNFSKRTGYGFFCGCESENTLKHLHENGHVKGDGDAHSDSPGVSFQFQPDLGPIVAPPVEMTIREHGRHILSVSKKGASRLTIVPDFIEPSEQQWMFEQLRDEIPWQQRNISIMGESIPQPRLTCWFGDIEYTYSGLTLTPLRLSPMLDMLRDRVKQHTQIEFNSLLANFYRDEKDSVDWHADDEVILGRKPTIASLSLGATRIFELRQRPDDGGTDFSLSQHIKVPLSAGMLIVMEGALQDDWQHRVPKEYHHRDPRINLTFRTIQATEKSE